MSTCLKRGATVNLLRNLIVLQGLRAFFLSHNFLICHEYFLARVKVLLLTARIVRWTMRYKKIHIVFILKIIFTRHPVTKMSLVVRIWHSYMIMGADHQ